MSRNNNNNADFNLTESVYGDMKRQIGEEGALRFRQEMESKNPEQELLVRRGRENFSTLSEQEVRDVLIANKWDEDDSLISLFELTQKKANEKTKIQVQRVNARLDNISKYVDDETLRHIIEKNEGDVERTVEELMDTFPQIKGDQERELQFRQLEKRFGEVLSSDEILKIFKTHNYNTKSVLVPILKLADERKKEKLAALFPNTNQAEISQAVEQNKDIRSSIYMLRQNKAQKNDLAAAAVLAEAQPPKTNQVEPVATTPVVAAASSKLNEPIVVVAQPDPETINKRANEILGEMKEDMVKQNDIFNKELQDKIRFNPASGPGFANNRVNNQQQQQQQQIDRKESPITEQQGENLQNSSRQVELKVDRVILDAGEKVNISYYFLGDELQSSHYYDWIAIYNKNESNYKNYITYEWIGKTNEREGTITFTVPSTYGSYCFRYLSEQSYSVLSASTPSIEVGPEFDFYALPDRANKSIRVHCHQRSGNSYPQAWIGMFDIQQKVESTKYTSFEWVTKTDGKGYIDFTPSKFGSWAFKLYLTSPLVFGYPLEYQRCQATLGGDDKLDISYDQDKNEVVVNYQIETVDPYAESAWIGVYFTSETNARYYRRYKRVDAGGVGCVRISAPRTAGVYNARLVTAGYVHRCTSANEITLAGSK